jgi:hypothetical protein
MPVEGSAAGAWWIQVMWCANTAGSLPLLQLLPGMLMLLPPQLPMRLSSISQASSGQKTAGPA